MSTRGDQLEAPSTGPLAAGDGTERAAGARAGLASTVAAWLAGPVFQKEARVMGRRKSTYLARSMLALALIGVAALAFWAVADETAHYRGVAKVQAFQRLAPGLAAAIAWTMFVVATVAAPVLTGGAICDERRSRSLAALATTPLRPGQIVLGKLASRLVQLVILVLLTAPLMLSLRAFGGLESSYVLGATCLTLSSGLLAASLGLLASNRAARPINAASFGVTVMILYNLWPAGGMLVQYWATGRPPSTEWLTFGPGMCLAMLSAGSMPGMTFDPATFWIKICAISVALSAVVCIAASVRLGVMIRRDAAEEPSLTRPAKRKRTAAATASLEHATADPARADSDGGVSAVSREVGDQPVLWREMRQAAFRSGLRLAIGLAAVVGMMLLVYANAGLREPGVTTVFAVIGAIVLMFGAATASVGSITGEAESRTWQVLNTTLLTPAEILGGKIAGALRRLWVVPALLLGHCVLAVLAGAVSAAFIPLLALILAGPVVFLCTTGVALSLRLRRTSAAGVANMLIASGLWAMLPMAIGIAGEVTRAGRDSFAGRIMQAALILNPVYMTGSAANGLGRSSWGGSRSRFELVWQNVGPETFTICVVFATGVYLAASFAVFHLCLRRYGQWSALKTV